MQKILNFLEKQTQYHHPNEIKKCLEILEIKIPPQKVILVTGTNGKGSTSATLQTLLIHSGKNVGFFSSPHIININERIKFNGNDISDEKFREIFKKVHEKIKNFNLSYFEYLTVMAAYYFYFEREVDFAIFEIGLGGTLDATNAIDHDISVITRLGLEHEDVLGKGIKSIAENKLGIIQKDNIVFHEKFPQEISELIERKKFETNAKFIENKILKYFVEKNSQGYPEYFLKTENDNYKLNLLGERAVRNTSLAITVFKHLVPNYEDHFSALSQVRWPCRMEKVKYQNRDIFLSGDHNPQGVQSLIEILQNFDFENIYFVVGICFDKNSDEMIKLLSSVKNAHIYLTETPQKTIKISNYSDFIKSRAEFSSAEPISALNFAVKNASTKDLIVVTGSLYLTGQIKTSLI